MIDLGLEPVQSNLHMIRESICGGLALYLSAQCIELLIMPPSVTLYCECLLQPPHRYLCGGYHV